MVGNVRPILTTDAVVCEAETPGLQAVKGWSLPPLLYTQEVAGSSPAPPIP
jgi:hypothetical protein